jgi:undecaprenyl-diphosphatase
MDLIQAIVISILQGVSELFPVSSLGHAVILPKLLHWSIKTSSPSWLAFLVALHIGTATALLIFFWSDWRSVILAFVRSVREGNISGADHDQRLAWMVVLGTIPAGLVGFALQKPLQSLFATPYVAASFLIVNGCIMFLGERLIQRQMAVVADPIQANETDRVIEDRLQRVVGASPLRGGDATTLVTDETAVEPKGQTSPEQGRYRDITQLSWRDAAIVGFAQIGALIPGISRSGITMVAGLAAGLSHEAAARYAFLLATPIIAAAGVLELPQLLGPQGRPILGYAILGMFLAGIAAYVSVRFLMRYFEFGRLYPFAWYSVGAGVLSLILLSANL